MAKFLLRCAEDVDIFHAAAVIAGSVMRIALEMLLMIRAFGQTHASRYNNLCIISDAVCTISLAWLQSLNVIIDDFTFVLTWRNVLVPAKAGFIMLGAYATADAFR